MAQLREEFAQVCPEASVQIELLRPDKVDDAVIEGHADLGFISYPESRRDLAVIPWREERMTVAAHPSHRFAGRDSVEPPIYKTNCSGSKNSGFAKKSRFVSKYDDWVAPPSVKRTSPGPLSLPGTPGASPILRAYSPQMVGQGVAMCIFRGDGIRFSNNPERGTPTRVDEWTCLLTGTYWHEPKPSTPHVIELIVQESCD